LFITTITHIVVAMAIKCHARGIDLNILIVIAVIPRQFATTLILIVLLWFGWSLLWV